MEFINVNIQTVFLFLNITNSVILSMLIFYGISSKFSSSLKLFILAKVLEVAGSLFFLNHPMDYYIYLKLCLFLLLLGFSIEIFCIIGVGLILDRRHFSVYFSFSMLMLIFLLLPPIIFEQIRTDTIIASVYETILFLISGTILLFFNNSTKLRKVSGLLQLMMALLHLIIISATMINESLVFLFMFTKIILSTMIYLLLRWELAVFEITELASNDFLTGILNRREFITLSKKILQLMIRQKKSISVLMMDLDRFKSINDNYGHLTGDMVLVHFSRTVEKYIRKQDVFARFGGEEFVVFLPGTLPDEAQMIAERIRTHYDRDIINNPDIPPYTVSIGVTSTLPDTSTVFEEIIRIADNAMYEAKETGRNRTVFREIQNVQCDYKLII